MSELSFDEYEDLAAPVMDWTYDHWYNLMLAYAKENYHDWHPRMWDRFSSDIAEVWSGEIALDNYVATAINKWWEGRNFYSPHAVDLEGYDHGEWLVRLEGEVAKKLAAYALKSTDFDVTFDENSARRFARDALANYDVSIIDWTYRQFQEALVKWLRGVNPFSPHHIPYEAEVLELRKERRVQLIERYGLSSSFSASFVDDASKPFPSNYELLHHIAFTQWYNSDIPDAEKEITRLGGEEKLSAFLERNITDLRPKYLGSVDPLRWV